MKKKFLSVMGVIAISTSLCGGMVNAATFPDVKTGDWYYGYVTDVSEKGLITGYADGRFGATDNLTRGQFATILHRMEQSPDVTFSGAFPDVVDGVFYSDPAEWANKEGLITGYANGKFGPVDNLTREQLATIMYRYAKWEGEDVSAKGDLGKFPDGSRVSVFAEDAMEWAVGEGIVSGNADGTLAPQGTVSRAVAATIISRYTSNDNTDDTVGKDEEEGITTGLSDDWKDMQIAIDGKLYKLPVSYKELEADGWKIEEEYANGYTLKPGEMSFSVINLTKEGYEEYDLLFWVGFVNLSEKAQDIKECDIWSIDVDSYGAIVDDAEYPLVEIAKGIKYGSTEADIIAAFGECDEDDIYVGEDMKVYSYCYDYSKYLDICIYKNYGVTAISIRDYAIGE